MNIFIVSGLHVYYMKNPCWNQYLMWFICVSRSLFKIQLLSCLNSILLHQLFVIDWYFVCLVPKGGLGFLMSPPCLESQGCQLIPRCHPLSCYSAWYCYSHLLSLLLLVQSPAYFPEFLSYSLFSFLFRDNLLLCGPWVSMWSLSWRRKRKSKHTRG